MLVEGIPVGKILLSFQDPGDILLLVEGSGHLLSSFIYLALTKVFTIFELKKKTSWIVLPKIFLIKL